MIRTDRYRVINIRSNRLTSPTGTQHLLDVGGGGGRGEAQSSSAALRLQDPARLQQGRDGKAADLTKLMLLLTGKWLPSITVVAALVCGAFGILKSSVVLKSVFGIYCGYETYPKHYCCI